MSEAGFISAILASPRDDVARLVYADWLEEHDDRRGEFLRLTVRLEHLLETEWPQAMAVKLQRVREIGRLRARFRELSEVVPQDWVLLLWRGQIHHCNFVGFVGSGADCPRRWEALRQTDNPTVRECKRCMRPVVFCRSIADVERCLDAGRPVVKSLALDSQSAH